MAEMMMEQQPQGVEGQEGYEEEEMVRFLSWSFEFCDTV